MDPGWLSNAYLVADEPGGVCVFVDSGAPLEPLLQVVEGESLTPTHLLLTHGHADHVAGNDRLVERFGIPIERGRVETAAWSSTRCRCPATRTTASRSSSTDDRLHRGHAVPGLGRRRRLRTIRRSVMEVLMTLPPEHARPPRPHRRDHDRRERE